MTATMAATDTLLDPSKTDADVMNVTVTGATSITTVNIETINLDYTVAAQDFTAANTATTAYNVSGAVAGTLSTPTSGATITLNDYGRVLTVEGLVLTGTAALGSAESLSIAVSGATHGATAAAQTGVDIDGTDANALETLNIASSGAAANAMTLTVENTETIGKVVATGSADLTVRVAEALVDGVTIDGSASTGEVNLSFDTDSDITTNAANWTGVDNVIYRDDDATAQAATLNSVVSGQNIEIANSVAVLTVTAQGATYAALANAGSLQLNGTSTTAGVTVATYNAQNMKTLNLASEGLASSTATTAPNTISNLDGDFTSIVITGDTSLTITDLDIEAVQTATTATTARAVTVDASAMTGNAFASITASADAKVSYSITGTGKNDTLVANNSGSTLNGGEGVDTLTGGNGVDTASGGLGNDHIDASYGADVLTGGGGNDTYDIDAAAVAATAEVTDLRVTITGTPATAGTLVIKLHTGETMQVAVDGSATTAEVEAAMTAALKLTDATQAGLLSATDGTGEAVLTFSSTLGAIADATVMAQGVDGTFAASAIVGTATNKVTVTVAEATAGVTARDMATTITDFNVGDVLDVVGLSLTADGGYYEGDASAMVAATEYQVIVMTDTSHTSSVTAADEIDARYSGTDTDSQLFVYLDSTKGHAVMALDSNINVDTAATLNEIVEFTSLTNLTDVAAAFSADSFTLA
jgi:hypothetical protein